MGFNLKIGDSRVHLEPAFEPPNEMRVDRDGTTYQVNFERISGNRILMSVNGRQVIAWVKENEDGKGIFVQGQYYVVRDMDLNQEADVEMADDSMTENGPDIVTPPMPSVVIQVCVEPGDWVEKGDVVIRVSAMKMETDLKAPHAGRITQIHVKEDDKVMPGDKLVDIDPQT